MAGPAEFVHGLSRRAAWASAVRDAGLAPGICITSDFSAQGGADATNRLLALVDGETGTEVALPSPELVVRASTAPPRHSGTGALSKGSVEAHRHL